MSASFVAKAGNVIHVDTGHDAPFASTEVAASFEADQRHPPRTRLGGFVPGVARVGGAAAESRSRTTIDEMAGLAEKRS